MNISSKTRRLVILSLLSALIIIFALTPLGYIRLPGLSITLLCIPVIIGAVMEGLVPGLILAFIFGATSFVQAMLGDPFGQALFNISIARYTLLVFAPRLLIPVTAHFSNKLFQNLFKGNWKKLRFVLVAAIGTLTNTIFFLFALYQLYLPEINSIAEMFGTIPERITQVLVATGLTNGIPEMITAMIIVPLVCIPLEMIYKKEPKNKENDSNI